MVFLSSRVVFQSFWVFALKPPSGYEGPPGDPGCLSLISGILPKTTWRH